jgi:protease-4
MNVSKSGESKDMGSPFKGSTKADEAIFQALTDQMADRFYSLVQKHRELTAEQMKQVASARIYLAPEAKEIGLVDEIGYLKDAIAKSKSMAGLSTDAKVITFRRYEAKDDNIYIPSMQGAGGGPDAVIPNLTQWAGMPEAGFYYIWPSAVGGP